ncbi:DinB family protein [Thalassotalea euphylliae]|uniref:DinB family protein n=1 Tax=Thalassotalea euphylliae TaxID=1655234 RepID=UPI0015F28FF9|nr:DinB family protein [Thalassotalea euphylliae]
MQRDFVATIQQGIDFLSGLSQTQYTTVPDGFLSAIGGHIRHIVDHFVALEFALESSLVNYELRQRNSPMERDLAQALARLEQLKTWLSALPDSVFTQSVEVQADVGIGTDNVMSVQSTFGRELMFACSHAIHHYATMKAIHLTFGGESSVQFGLAPSTASYMRQQDSTQS